MKRLSKKNPQRGWVKKGAAIERNKLHKERRRDDGILSRSPAVAFIWKNAAGWPVEYVSHNVSSIFGWGKDDFLAGRISYTQVVHPDDLSRVTEEVDRFSTDPAAGRVLHAPYRIVTREGAVKWVEDLTTILRNEDGGVAAYEGILIDITERKDMEEKLHLIQFSIDQASEGITWFDSNARIVYVNEEECRLLGYSREELQKMTVFDVDPTVTPEVWQKNWEDLRRWGEITREAVHRRKNGEIFPIESSIRFVRYNDREYSFAFRRDITERKRAEAEKERLRTQLESAVKIANLGPWEHDIVNDVFILNDHFYRIYQTTAEQAGGYTLSTDEHIRRFTHPDDIPMVMEEMRKIMAKIDSVSGHQIEHRFLYPDGTVGYVAVRMFFVKDSTGRVVKAYGVNQDVTERRLAERERLANLKYFETMEEVNQAIQGGANDLDRIMRSVLDVCLSVFECDRAFLLHPCDPEAPFWSIQVERTRPEYPGGVETGKPIPMNSDVARIFRINLSSQGAVSFSAESNPPVSKEFWERHGFHSQMAVALHPKIGKPWQFGIHQCSHARQWSPEEEALFENIARRLTDSLTSLLMYRDLRKNQEFLSNIVENIPGTILVKDAEELRFRSINKAGEKLLGFAKEEVIGKNSYDLVPQEQARRYDESDREALEKGAPVEVPEETIRDRAGEPRIVHTKKIPLLDDAGKPQHLLIISEDITDFKRLQAQLSHAQKMEALGTMSGGIAHDFNNILQPMLGYCEFLKEDIPADSPQQEFVDGIFRSGLRAKDLVNQILAFSRQSDRKTIPVELQLVVKEAVNLCRSIIPPNIEITREIQRDCGPIMADPTQLHQIVMNLMINAYHALEQTGGKISVYLNETQLAADDLKGVFLPPGKYAKLSISDTGCGMTSEVLEKIFEPYFTTKPQGKGTGLGLAVAYGIVKEYGGHINVYSEVDKGTTFNIYLPLTEKNLGRMTAEKAETYRAAGNEHILLVDDEEVVLDLERNVLERLGYRVSTCRNGAEALAVFSEDPKAFNLVITDMNMPNMNGDQLAGKILDIRPDIPIIICTGFSEKIGRDESRAIGVKEFLMKPITISEMSEKVLRVLDKTRT